jgi:hypothetical protein
MRVAIIKLPKANIPTLDGLVEFGLGKFGDDLTIRFVDDLYIRVRAVQPCIDIKAHKLTPVGVKKDLADIR